MLRNEGAPPLPYWFIHYYLFHHLPLWFLNGMIRLLFPMPFILSSSSFSSSNFLLVLERNRLRDHDRHIYHHSFPSVASSNNESDMQRCIIQVDTSQSRPQFPHSLLVSWTWFSQYPNLWVHRNCVCCVLRPFLLSNLNIRQKGRRK